MMVVHRHVTRTLEFLPGGSPDFRRYYLGQFVSGAGSWAETVAEAWLAYVMTQSPALVALLVGARSLPALLLSVPAGLVVDRYRRRTVLLLANGTGMLLAAILAAVTATDRLVFPELVVFVFLLGCVSAFELPARQVYMAELAGPEHLGESVALTALSHNVARVVGPVIGGIVIATGGAGSAFALNSLAFGVVIIALARNTNGGEERRARGGNSLDSLRRVCRDRDRLWILALVAVNTVFAAPYVYLGPSIISGVGGQAQDLGLMWAAIGIGAIVATTRLSVVAGSDKHLRLTPPSLWIGFGLLSIAASPALPFTLLAFVLVGWSMATFLAISTIWLLSLTPLELRGTASALFVLTATGCIPVGSLVLGGIAEATSARSAFAVGAVVWVGVVALVAQRRLLALESGPAIARRR